MTSWRLPNFNRSALVLVLLEIVGNGGIVATKYIVDSDWKAWAAHSILSVSIGLGVVHRRGKPDASDLPSTS